MSKDKALRRNSLQFVAKSIIKDIVASCVEVANMAE
jgi:hypothetical protein